MSLCTECGTDTVVLETRIGQRSWRLRRRQCKACGHRFSTYEVPADILTIDETPDEEPPPITPEDES